MGGLLSTWGRGEHDYPPIELKFLVFFNTLVNIKSPQFFLGGEKIAGF